MGTVSKVYVLYAPITVCNHHPLVAGYFLCSPMGSNLPITSRPHYVHPLLHAILQLQAFTLGQSPYFLDLPKRKLRAEFVNVCFRFKVQYYY